MYYLSIHYCMNNRNLYVRVTKVGEWCVSRYPIFPKCRIPWSRKFRHCALLANVENWLSAVPPDLTKSVRQPLSSTAHLFKVSPHPQPLRSVSPSSLSFFQRSIAFPSGCHIVFRLILRILHRFQL